MTGNANNLFIFPIAFTNAYGMGGLCEGVTDAANSNVLSLLEQTLSQVYIRGTYCTYNGAIGYQNNYSRIIILGY